MMMSKKPRPPMKRTTSLKQFTVDLPTSETESDPPTNPFKTRQKPASYGDVGRQKFQSGGFDHGGLPSMVSPRNGRRFSDEFETANFLRSCNLCKRRLVPTRDLYMYRGNTAFCSDECRQQQMNQDEIKEKRSLLSTNKESSPSSSSSSSSISKSTKNEIVVVL